MTTGKAARKPEKDEKKEKERELESELEDTFPASDPPSITQPKPSPGAPKGRESTDGDKKRD